MKRISLFLCLMLAATVAMGQAKSYTTNGTTYKAVQSDRSTSAVQDTVTPYTYEVSGTQYHIHIGKTGACYIVRVSKKSGKEYRQYLGEEISRDICAKMGRTYTAKKKSSK